MMLGRDCEAEPRLAEMRNGKEAHLALVFSAMCVLVTGRASSG